MVCQDSKYNKNVTILNQVLKMKQVITSTCNSKDINCDHRKNEYKPKGVKKPRARHIKNQI